MRHDVAHGLMFVPVRGFQNTFFSKLTGETNNSRRKEWLARRINFSVIFMLRELEPFFARNAARRGSLTR
jgi:hypothetical protein